MGETELVPPMPPSDGEVEETQKEKKGFFKKFLKKKEGKNEEKVEIPDTPIPEPESNSEENPVQDNKEIDEISKLIDETINDIQKLQGSKEEISEPAPIAEKKVEVKINEPVKETKLEEPKEKPTVNLPSELVNQKVEEPKKIPEKPKDISSTSPISVKRESKPKLEKPKIEAKKPVEKKIEKPRVEKRVEKPKSVTKKPVVKKAPVKVAKKVSKSPVKKSKKSYSLPAFEKVEKTKSTSTKNTNYDSRIKEIESTLKNSIPKVAKNPFVCNDGRKFDTLQGMVSAIESMNDETFKHHVNESRNDFSNWIKAEMNDEALAKKVDSFFIKHDILRTLKEGMPKTIDSKQIASLNKELKELKEKKAKEAEEKRYSLPPQDFFKIDNKTIKSIHDLENAVNKISQHEFSTYVTRNKVSFTKWLAFLTRDFQKQAKEIDTKYQSLVKKVLSEVNDKVDKKISEAKSTLQKSSKELTSVKSQVEKLQKQKKDFLAEQKTLSAKKKQLMAEVSKVKKEHEQVHKLKEKTKLEKNQLHKDIAEAKKSLEREKAEHKRVIKEAKETAKKELSALSNQAGSLKTKIKAEEDKIRKEWDKLKAREEEIEKRDALSKKREATVTKREESFESEKHRIETLVKNFEEREKQIELQKSELEVAGFQKYLDAKLKEIHKTDLHDMTFDRDIEKARDIVKSGDVESAKRMYLSLKEKFESASLSASEKDRVYNLLRELYDDIMLALSQ